METRRTTLAVVNSSNLNSRSSMLPIASGNRRQTLMAPPAKLSRASSMAGAARKSSMGGNNNRRRSSVGRASLYPTSKTGRVQDPRPISDKGFQMECIKDIIEYLCTNGYELPISPKQLSSPSARDFQSVVGFLFARIDPMFEFEKATAEEQVMTMFKRLKYPFTINKSALKAVGVPHTWPTLLAAIHWLVELLRFHDEVEWSKQDALARANLPLDAQESVKDEEGKNGLISESTESLFYAYLGDAYQSWLEGEDDDETMDSRLGAIFEAKNGAVKKEIADLEAANEEMRAEIEIHETQPSPLEQISRKRNHLDADVKKFKSIIATLESHRGKLNKRIDEARVALTEKRAELEASKTEKEELEYKIKTQELSVDDVERINRERGRLQEQLSKLEQQKNDANKLVWQLEDRCSKVVTELEKSLATYAITAERLNLTPITAKNAKGLNYELHFVHEGVSSAVDMLPGASMNEIKQGLAELKAAYIVRFEEASNTLAQIEEEFAQATDKLSEAQEKDQSLRIKLGKLEESHSTEKETSDSFVADQQKQIDALEEEIKRLRQMNNDDIGKSEQELSILETRLEAAKRQWGVDRDQAKTMLATTLDRFDNHKTKIASSLQELASHYDRINQELVSNPPQV